MAETVNIDIDADYDEPVKSNDNKWFLCTILLLVVLVMTQVTRVMEEKKRAKLKKLKLVVKN